MGFFCLSLANSPKIQELLEMLKLLAWQPAAVQEQILGELEKILGRE